MFRFHFPKKFVLLIVSSSCRTHSDFAFFLLSCLQPFSSRQLKIVSSSKKFLSVFSAELENGPFPSVPALPSLFDCDDLMMEIGMLSSPVQPPSAATSFPICKLTEGDLGCVLCLLQCFCVCFILFGLISTASCCFAMFFDLLISLCQLSCWTIQAQAKAKSMKVTPSLRFLPPSQPSTSVPAACVVVVALLAAAGSPADFVVAELRSPPAAASEVNGD